VILNNCLVTAVKKKRLASNPAASTDPIKIEESNAWNVLDPDQLNELVRGFKDTTLYGIVCVAAFTGMRRNEILALRWVDVDFTKSTITVSRSIEETKQKGRTVKGPKTKRGNRVIAIDTGLLEILRVEYARHLRIKAGVPDGAQVSLDFVRLPADALVFPSLVLPFDFTRLRSPSATTDFFVRRATALGFPIRLHDLRHTHGTILLRKGVPIPDVAGRLGHSPHELLKTYAHCLPDGDKQAADIMATITRAL
jgi:integrase